MAWTFRDHVNELLVYTCNEHLYEVLSFQNAAAIFSLRHRPCREIFWSAAQTLTWFSGGPKASAYDQLRPSQARPKNVSPPRVPRGLIFKSYECNSSRTTELPKACLSVPRHILLLLESGMQISWYIRPCTLSCIVSICDTFRCLLCPSS